MRNVRFPEPVTFDTFGGPQTEGAAVKVLEEAAELVEAVKELERLPSSPDGQDNEPLWKVQARERVLDEAMDVYQALANFSDGEMERDVFSLSFVEFGKDAALSVLLHAAALYSDSRWSGGYRAEWVRWTMWALANLIGDEFGDGEIADAYARCVERNRERGRL